MSTTTTTNGYAPLPLGFVAHLYKIVEGSAPELHRCYVVFLLHIGTMFPLNSKPKKGHQLWKTTELMNSRSWIRTNECSSQSAMPFPLGDTAIVTDFRSPLRPMDTGLMSLFRQYMAMHLLFLSPEIAPQVLVLMGLSYAPVKVTSSLTSSGELHSSW